METNDSQWPAGRVVHLLGGMRAINMNGPEVRISPNTLHGKIMKFQSGAYGAVFSDLQQLGFSVVGVDFYSQISEVKGETPPNWRVFNQCTDTVWPSEEAARIWSGIAHAAFKQKEGHVWDLASRIKHQLRVCGWRVRQLSESYHQQLMAKARRSDVKPGQRFEDGFTWNTYLSVNSYLVDACILRDYLSEFAATFIFGKRYGIDATHISTLGGLLKKVLNRGEVVDPLADALRIATREGGWLKTLGEYRDLVVHSAPLAHAEMRLYAITDSLQIDAEGAVLFVKIPLPNDPGSIAARRSSRDLFSEFEDQFDKFIKSLSDDPTTIDALTYIVQAHGELAKLATTLSAESPIPYQDIVLTDKDIIGPIKIITQ